MNILNESQLKRQKTFSIFLEDLNFAFSQFVIWKDLQNAEYNPIFEKNKYVWTTLIRSLFLGFSAKLAKLTENFTEKQNPRYGEVISIFYLLELVLEEYKETLEKIKRLRNKILMHNDLETLTNLNSFTKELDLKYGDIEDVFQKLISVLDQVKSNFNDSTDCKKYFSDLETSCRDDIRKFMMQLLETR